MERSSCLCTTALIWPVIEWLLDEKLVWGKKPNAPYVLNLYCTVISLIFFLWILFLVAIVFCSSILQCVCVFHFRSVGFLPAPIVDLPLLTILSAYFYCPLFFLSNNTYGADLGLKRKSASRFAEVLEGWLFSWRHC